MSELAQFNSAEAARNAYYSGSGGDGDTTDDGEQNGGEDGWTEWFRVDQVADWYVYGREALEEDNVQFHVTGETQDGRQVFLDTDGTISESMVVFENMDEVNAALEAFYQREEDGDVPDDDSPTGPDPGPGGAPPPGAGSGGGGGLPIVNQLPVLGNLGTMGQLIAVLVIAFAVYYYRSDGDVELPVVGGVGQ